MRKLFYAAFDFLLFSNLFMAFCAVAQALVTFILIGAKPVYPVLAILFCSTLFIYNFSILITKPQHPELSPFKRVHWFFARYKLMVAITIISAILLLPLFFWVSPQSKILLVLLSVLSIGYGMPLFSVGKQKFGLRNIPGLKLLLIGLTWALSIVLLPIFEAQHLQHLAISKTDILLLTAKRFLFITAMAIPFDIRDLFHDRKVGLKTIPVVFGEKNAYLLCQILLAGYLVLLFFFREPDFNSNFFALAITIVLASWLIFRSNFIKNEYYYFFYVDGVLILQYVLMLVFKSII
ncbi:UbiA family prenyltransferase [uncultured Mucilaginibacter sp.]|uniref:UbiA family prenyltransferase n=1 Tax=uncultured Mucilaginibacter sp. TaxID=797541 RepID=UPI002629EFA2|nr:UbiA family prenyltransferase [uncultured Mucilaginibacter sp.]